MFGMGFSEIIVILVVALIFLGPEKLPDAAKSISKGIRDLRKQSRDLQQQIESDEHIGGAIRDLRSALRGEEPRPAPPAAKAKAKGIPPPIPTDKSILPPHAPPPMRDGNGDLIAEHPAQPDMRLPPVAGEIDDPTMDDSGLAGLVRPAPGTVAKGSGAGSDHG